MLPEHIIHDLLLLWSELAVAALIVLLFTAEIIFGNIGKRAFVLCGMGLLVLLAFLATFPAETPRSLFGGLLSASHLTHQLHLLLIGATLLSMLLGKIFPDKAIKIDKTEYYILLLGALLGLLLMVRAQSLLMLFMALETVSVCSYGLVFFMEGKKTTEAGVKYILFGIFSSALMLYGISLWYSIGGSLTWAQTTAVTLPEWGSALVVLFIAAGLLFKTSAVPFHIWMPDVLEGAPLPVATFLTVVPKAGALAALLLPATTLANQSSSLAVVAVAAIGTLIIGTLAALWQTNMRRLMAYAAIAQAGFLLMPVVAPSTDALVYYLWVYVVLNLIAFAVMAWAEGYTGSQAIEAFAGGGTASPVAGVAMLIAMAGFIGLPPTAGFAAKLLVLSAVWQQWKQQQSLLLSVLFMAGLAATVISVYFYLKVPYQLFFKQGRHLPHPLTMLQRLWLLALSAAALALLMLH